MKRRKQLAQQEQLRLRLHFLGAAKSVTGSLHFFELTEAGNTIRFFIDCGLDQENDSRNYQNRLPKGLKARDINFGIFTHAHIDHIGFLPKLVKDGFSGPVYATPPTIDLAGILLPDSGHLQEEAARERMRRRRQTRSAAEPAPTPRHKQKGRKPSSEPRAESLSAESPPNREPLYTEAEAVAALRQLIPLEFGRRMTVSPSLSFEFKRASHLLGAAQVLVEFGQGARKRRLVVSGDLGRPGMPILKDVETFTLADYLLCEGTYGARLHPVRSRAQTLATRINSALERAGMPGRKPGSGVILIPAFAVGRVQSVLFDLKQLMQAGRIPQIPVYVDSPMANRATNVYRAHKSEHDQEEIKSVTGDPFSTPLQRELLTSDESRKLDEPQDQPVIIVSPSGMATGGRVIHHLRRLLPDRRNTVLFIGFQAPGTLGRRLKELGETGGKKPTARVAGVQVSVNATVDYLEDYSGHADYADILTWLSCFSPKPKRVFLVHGEEESLSALQGQIRNRHPNLDVYIPSCREYVDLP